MSPGFDVDPVLVAQVGLIRARPGEAQNELLERLSERARTVPGVTMSAFSTSVPLTVSGGSTSGRSVTFDDRPGRHHVEYSRAEVGTGYFGALGIRLLAGRDFSRDDRAGAPRVMIVNEAFARRYLGGEAVGRRVRYEGDQSGEYQIVGVVGNGKYRTLGEEQRAAIYLPLSQSPPNRDVAFVFARVNGDAAGVASVLRSAVSEVDRSVSVSVQPMRSALAFALLPSRAGAAVLGGLGLLGLVLAAFGLFAIVSYNVSRRTSEIAIRSALGASRGSIVGLVIRDASILVGGAVVVGLGIAALATRALSSFLVAGLSATDPLSFLGTGGVFLLVTLLASWLPARYALRVSPVVAMRLE
jgi:predicted permease